MMLAGIIGVIAFVVLGLVGTFFIGATYSGRTSADHEVDWDHFFEEEE